jgi:hypothetical protein
MIKFVQTCLRISEILGLTISQIKAVHIHFWLHVEHVRTHPSAVIPLYGGHM